MARRRKQHPTHRVMFGDDITGICQGWRFASVVKVGTKWIYFKLFEGNDHTYKAKLPRWHALQKYEVDKKGQRIAS